MALTLSRFFVESPGNTILAANYNGEFDNLITGIAVGSIDDSGLADNVAAFQVTEDPGEVGTESLPSTVLGELRRYRNMFAEMSGKTQWYESPSISLETVNSTKISSPGASTDNAIARWDGAGGNAVQDSSILIDDSNNLTGINDLAVGNDLTITGIITSALTIGDGTGTGTTPDMTINKNTGDAGLRLQVGNSSATAWDIKVDNSQDDRLLMDFNSASAVKIRNTTTSPITIDSQNIASGATPEDNTIYSNIVPKAWANIEPSPSFGLNGGVNLSIVRNSTGNYTCTFANAMANANYVIIATAKEVITNKRLVNIVSQAAGSFVIQTITVSGTVADAGAHVVVFGEQ